MPDKKTPEKKTPEDPAQAASEEALSYEAAREELIEVVRRLEAGGTTLEESIALWERGEHLSAVCQERLDGARRRLEEVIAATESPTAEG